MKTSLPDASSVLPIPPAIENDGELNQFFLWRQFIASAPNPNPHPQKIWDLFNINCFFLNGDDDAHKECYILLMTGFSLQPRGMLRFDIDQKKVTARSPFSGAVVANPVLIDLNDDILAKAIARIEKNMERQLKKEVISEQQMQDALSRITLATDMKVCATSALVVEAASENQKVKEFAR